MKVKTIATIGILLASVATLSACGNTIRGVGRDTANAVDATQDAGRSVDRAAQN
ncbi:entericidin domain-containing protein [Ensifer soli]|uniref:entericidin domain-containing protein n=1 Tax=Ciceribacter sp. sgz301302 TaxID=3342379 RepID=UPI0035BB48A2